MCPQLFKGIATIEPLKGGHRFTTVPLALVRPVVFDEIRHEKVDHLLSCQRERLAEIQAIQLELIAEVAALKSTRD